MAFGATDTVAAGDSDWAEQVRAMTDGLKVDVATEAVGLPDTFRASLAIVRPGGAVANVGVHGTSVELPMAGPVDQRHRDHDGAGWNLAHADAA